MSLLFQVLNSAQKPMVVVGSSALQREDSAAIHAAVTTIAQNAKSSSSTGEDWRVLNVLHRVSVTVKSSTTTHPSNCHA